MSVTAKKQLAESNRILVEVFANFKMTRSARIDLVDGAGWNDVHQLAQDDAILESVLISDTLTNKKFKKQIVSWASFIMVDLKKC